MNKIFLSLLLLVLLLFFFCKEEKKNNESMNIKTSENKEEPKKELNNLTVIIGKLEWKRCSEGQNDDEKCSGKAKLHQELIETDNYNEDGMGMKYLEEPEKACSNLNLKNGYAGKKDWRVPKKEELESLIKCSKGFNNNTDGCKKGSSTPTINSELFPNTELNGYWTSTNEKIKGDHKDEIVIVNKWVIYFDSGKVLKPSIRNSEFATRCVRTIK